VYQAVVVNKVNNIVLSYICDKCRKC